MLTSKTRLLAVSVAALTLGACASQQAPAPVVSGIDNSSIYTPSTTTSPPVASTTEVATTTTTAASNPYGATPYHSSNTSTPTPATPVVAHQPTRPANQPYVGNYAPVDVNASTHRVVSGDTVYNISKRYGISQDNLRAWNNIGADNAIHLGQTLRVKPVGGSHTVTSNTTTQPTPAKPVVNNTPATTPIINSASKNISGILWQAPTKGKIVQVFDGKNNKGVAISGTRGQPVLAAADGQVVYSGSSLRGYGNLIIVQHSKKYLTAYGHNEAPLLVSEGQVVKRGQQIAKMGSSDSSSGVKLHFELREDGKPVNPVRFVDIVQ